MQNLILHCGANKVSRSDLKDIPIPIKTSTYTPVPHVQIAELVTQEAQKNGYAIVSEEYGLSKSGEKMFGVLRFHPEGHPEYTRALGFRNSHDKSMAVGLTAGLSVLVCDNMCFGGETTIHRKHTSGIEIESLIHDAFDNLTYQYFKLEQSVDMLKLEKISISKAKLEIVRAAEMKAIPSCDIIPVLDEFKSPRHDEFSECNKWSLYNSFTEIAKKYSPVRADQCYKKLGNMFALN